MKWKAAVVTLLCFIFIDHAQTSDQSKVWILFKDRPFLKQSTLHPTQITHFTKEAIRRREDRATVAWDESDYPPDSLYINSLKQAGAKILVESRWLNGVSALCDSKCRQAVNQFSFVSEIRPVVTYRRSKEKILPAAPEELKPSANQLAYGSSLAQLQQIKVPFLHQRGFAGQGEIIAIFDAGFRKDHVAFKNATIVGEHDYVFNRDFVSDIDSHGTSTWSCVGGAAPGVLFGPGYKASFILAITEDVRSETQVEEDNWVAAFEWADRLGATVVSSSLGYIDWYTPADLNGSTPITSRVASTAAKKGIVVVNSAGNEGPGSQTLGAPADARNILAVGAVDKNGMLTFFSSRGPTADGRIKPEVVARGLSTWVATDFGTHSFGRGSGTSFSCPLVAGASAALLSAHQEWNPFQLREAVIQTANNAAQPDNDAGYGIPNFQTAYDYVPVNGINFQHTPLKNTSNHTAPIPVTARIRAYRGLNPSAVFVMWKRQGSANAFTQVHLSASATVDRFEGKIPTQPAGTTVMYFLTAKDSAGKVFKFPLHAPSDALQFEVK